MAFTENSWDSLQRLHELLQKTDTIMIGAGAGLSAAHGPAVC